MPSNTIETLLHPFAVKDFFERHWERVPLHVNGRVQSHFDSLLHVDEVDYLISAAASHDISAVEILKNTGKAERLDVRRSDRLAAAYREFKGGATLRTFGVQNYSKPLHDACRELEQIFGAPVRVNLYCTPAGAQGAPLHYDNHEVFVAQVHGSKRWKVHAPLVRLPLETVPPLPFEERGPELKYTRGGPTQSRSQIGDEASPPVLEATLVPGDLLYVPRGFIHEAATTSEASAHLTFGIHVVTWLDLFTVALAQVANADERFRESLPPNYLTGAASGEALRERFKALAESFGETACFKRALDEACQIFIRTSERVGGGTLFRAEETPKIKDETVLVRRSGLILRLWEDETACALESATGMLAMPAPFAQALRFIAGKASFAVREIPGGLGERSRHALAHGLVSEGFYVIGIMT